MPDQPSSQPSGTPPPESLAVPGVPKMAVPPQPGEVITSLATGNTYTMGEQIGEGNFGVVYSCVDVWENDLAAKVLKPIATYNHVKASAEAELMKLVMLRHPYVTYVFNAFEYRDTFYIVTERCYCPLTNLFQLKPFIGLNWLVPVARCLLQAVHYLHINQHVHQDIHAGNVFAAFARDEMRPEQPGAIHFKLGDLGVARLFEELGVANTRAQWMLPPEVLNPSEFGPIDYRLDIYHVGLLLLQIATSTELRFTRDEVLDGKPREIALALDPPYNFALEKALRRHVPFRTASAMELWRDLRSLQAAVPGDAQT